MPQKPCINGYYFCVVKMEELFAIAVSFGKIVRNRGFSQSIVGKRDFGLDSEGKSSLLFEDITFTFPSP